MIAMNVLMHDYAVLHISKTEGVYHGLIGACETERTSYNGKTLAPWFRFDPLHTTCKKDITFRPACHYTSEKIQRFDQSFQFDGNYWFYSATTRKIACIDPITKQWISSDVEPPKGDGYPLITFFYRQSNNTLIFVWATCIVVRRFGSDEELLRVRLGVALRRAWILDSYLLERGDFSEIVFNTDAHLCSKTVGRDLVISTRHETSTIEMIAIGDLVTLRSFRTKDGYSYEYIFPIVIQGNTFLSSKRINAVFKNGTRVYRTVYADEYMIFGEDRDWGSNKSMLRKIYNVDFTPEAYSKATKEVKAKLRTIWLLLRGMGVPKELILFVFWIATKSLLF